MITKEKYNENKSNLLIVCDNCDIFCDSTLVYDNRRNCDISCDPTLVYDNRRLICDKCYKVCLKDKCKEKTFGIFIFCKTHAKELLKSLYKKYKKWSPSNVGYINIKKINNYVNVIMENIEEKHISKGNNSKVPIICVMCKYIWSPIIKNIINNGYGCPECAGNVPYTLQRFNDRINDNKEMREKFDISKVEEKHISKGVYSKVPIKCMMCKYNWSPVINSVINGGHGCPECAGNVPWTLQRFNDRINDNKEMREKFDISKVEEKHISKGNNSKVPIKCMKCEYNWSPTIDSVIRGRGCPECAGKVPWTLQRFKDRINDNKEMREKFDISNVEEKHISNGAKSKVPIKCRKCKYIWSPTIDSVINNKSGCPKCSGSKGYSEGQIEWLKYLMKIHNIHIKHFLNGGEIKIEGIGKVDGYCEETNTVYEYNGDYWHGNPRIYDLNFLNKTSKKTMGELLMKTLHRELKLRNMGYKFVCIWECEWNEMKIVN